MSDDVALVGVGKRFGAEVTAIEHLDLTVARGEFFSLLGPSGCGKTTTLRIIAGFEQPTTGQVFVGGEDMAMSWAEASRSLRTSSICVTAWASRKDLI